MIVATSFALGGVAGRPLPADAASSDAASADAASTGAAPADAVLPVPGEPELSDLAVPAPSDRPPRSASATDPVALFAQLDALGRGGDWYLGMNNENGVLAWGESLVLAALIEMYEATGDAAYLDDFVRHADGLLAQTDEARDVTDWAGRSGPVWRSGSRYNYGSLVATGTDGEPMGVFIANSRLYNDSTLAEIRPSSPPGRFYVAFRNAKYRRAEGYARLTTDRRSPDYWVRRINERSTLVRAMALRGASDRTGPLPTGRRHFQHSYVVHAAHSGLMAYPLARFARLVTEEPSLAPAYATTAAIYLAAAERAVAFHDDDYVDSALSGYYRFEPGAPLWCDGVGVPHNQNLAMARALLELYRATGNWSHRARAEKLALRLRLELGLTHRHAYVWRYWWGPGMRGWRPENSPSFNTPSYGGHRAYEDLMHGAHDVDLVADAADAGIVFDHRDVARMANTLALTMRNNGGFFERVNGQTVASSSGDGITRAGRWLALAAVSRDLHDVTTPGLADALLGGETYGFELYAAALLARVRAGYSAGTTPTALAAPTVQIVAPVAGRAGGSVAVRAATGLGALAPELFLDGRSGAAIRQTGPAAWSVDTSGLRDGRRTFEVVVADHLDRARTARVSVVVDNTPPRVRWRRAPGALTPNGDADGDAAWWLFGASEWGKRRVVVTDARRVVVAEPLPWTTRAAGWTGARFDGRTAAGRLLPEGRYVVRAFAADGVGNVKALPARTAVVSRLARWKTPATRRLQVWGGTRVPVRLYRPAAVSAALYRGSRRVAGVRPAAPARAGWLSLPVSRRIGRTLLPRGTYALRVDARDRLGAVSLVRAVELR